MAYKILYIEDQNANSVKSDVEQFDIEVIICNPESFEKTNKEMNSEDYQGILMDFKLDEGDDKTISFTAPSLAQNLRSNNIENKKHKPIFLITNQSNISTYYKDFTSHDLFDFVKTKKEFRENLPKMAKRIKSFIEAYKTIETEKHKIKGTLSANDTQISYVDYRIIELLENEKYRGNSNKIAFYVYHNIIQSFNFLVGEDVVSARLGIKKTSDDWGKLLSLLEKHQYNGIYSSSHKRWWWNDVEEWWNGISDNKNLRRTSAEERCKIIVTKTGLSLSAHEKIKFAISDRFWTICKDTAFPIDPIDGLELMEKELLPWQDKEYISMIAALQTSKSSRHLFPDERQRMIDFNNSLNG
jgi:hypothetical protein